MGSTSRKKGAPNRVLAVRNGARGFTLTEILAVMAILSLITVSLFTMLHQGTQTWRLFGARTEAYLKARQILEMMSREIKGAVLITAARGPTADPTQMGLNVPKRADFRGLDGFSDGTSKPLPDWRNQYQKFSDQVYFVTPVTNSGKQELCMVGYWVKDEGNDTLGPVIVNGTPRNSKDDALWRIYLTDNYGEPQEEWEAFMFSSKNLNSWSSQIGEVATSVRQLDIQYYDYDAMGRLKLYDAWDSRPTDYPGPAEEKGTTATKDDDNKLPVAVRITITVGDKDDIIKGVRLSTIVYLENAARR